MASLFGAALQAAQERIGNEINDFKQEAAQTEVWKEEEQRRRAAQAAVSDAATPPPAKQAANGFVAATHGFMAATPTPTPTPRSKFSIDAEPSTPEPEPTPATGHAGPSQGAAALARRVKELEEALREQKGRAVRDSMAMGEQHAKQL